MLKNNRSGLMIGVFSVGFVALVLDAIFYAGFLQKNILADSRLIAVVAMVLSLALFRSVNKAFRVHFLRLVVWALFVPLSCIWTGFVISEYLMYTNFVFNTFHIHFGYFLYLVLYCLPYVLHAIRNKVIVRKHLIIGFFILPLIILVFFLFLRLRRETLFFYLTAEDSILEYMQFLLFVGCGIVSWQLSRRISRPIQIKVLYGMAVVLFMFVAGEEISWGQRIADIPTPSHIAETNLQKEINIHNNERVFGYVYRAYMLIGLAGSTGWGIIWLLNRSMIGTFIKRISVLIPGPKYTLFFLTTFVYNYYKVYLKGPGGSEWEEIVEAIMVLGMYIFLLSSYRLHKRYESET